MNEETENISADDAHVPAHRNMANDDRVAAAIAEIKSKREAAEARQARAEQERHAREVARAKEIEGQARQALAELEITLGECERIEADLEAAKKRYRSAWKAAQKIGIPASTLRATKLQKPRYLS